MLYRFLIILVLSFSGLNIAFAKHDNEVKHILLLHSYHKGFKWTDDISKGVEDIINETGEDIEIYTEYMDSKKRNDSLYIQTLLSLYKQRYLNINIDVIISSDDNAFNFLKKYRDDLFPGCPVVFCGVNYFKDSDLEGQKLFTGVNEAPDIDKGIELILRLHPETKNIFVIVDNTTTGVKIRKRFDDLYPKYKERLSFKYLNTLKLDTLLNVVGTLSENDIIYYTIYFKDTNSKYLDYTESVSLICDNSNVPVYGLWDFSLGYGIVGGYLTSGYYQGLTAAMKAVLILEGNNPENIPVTKRSPNKYFFDKNVLDHWGIETDKLPNGSKIINQPDTYFSKHKKEIIVFIVMLYIIITLLINIYRRKKAESTVKESERRLSTLFSNLQGTAYRCLYDSNFTMVFLSDGCYNITGYTSDEMIQNKYLSYGSIIAEEDKENIWREIQKKISSNKHFQITYRIKTKSGEEKWVLEQGIGILDSNKNVIAIEGYISDITILKKAEEELIKAKEKAEESDQLKTSFLANMSHEIRTPLNAIIGFSNLLNNEEFSAEKKKEFINYINSNSDQLLKIISDILDVSKIETGQLRIVKDKYDINILLEELKLYASTEIKKIKKEDIDIIVHKDLSDDKSIIYTDKTRLRQILHNLIENAIKFTEKGSIEFGYKVKDHDKLLFYIKDTGIGISPEKYNIIFKRFRQADDTITRQYGGTGLGLPISRKLTEMMGGEIWLESEPGKGSTFYFTIPFKK